MQDHATQPVHVAGRFGYLQCSPTKAERERGFVDAYLIVDFSDIQDDGQPGFVFENAVASREAAISQAREQHRYHVEGGDAKNRAAIREWAQQLTA